MIFFSTVDADVVSVLISYYYKKRKKEKKKTIFSQPKLFGYRLLLKTKIEL